MTPPRPPRAAPGVVSLTAGAALARRRLLAEWRAASGKLGRSAPAPVQGLGASPRDLRTADSTAGRALARGVFTLGGATVDIGQGGDPWTLTPPSRAWALALHRFSWLPDLLTRGEAGGREAMRLTRAWLRQFEEPTGLAWSPEVLERRTFNLACASARLSAAGPADAQFLAESLAAHARRLESVVESPQREAERLVAAATAATALAGRAGTQLISSLAPRLEAALDAAVAPDGGLRTRSPQQGLELLFDLRTLDEALLQRGLEAPAGLSLAIERLSGAVRFFTLADGALAAFQGGESAPPAQTAAALARDRGAAKPYSYLPQSGFHRLSGPTLQVVMDVGAPAQGGWSEAACAQPLAIEVAAGGDRLFANPGWSPDCVGPQALRTPAGGNTASLGEGSPGRALDGWRADGLGARLIDGAERVDVRRNESEAGAWLEASHDGWVRLRDLMHERRLFLDAVNDELRGEDRFYPSGERLQSGGRTTPYAVRFHVPPEVKVSLALDGRSVLLQGPSNRRWWFRTDASEVGLEPSAHFRQGLPYRSVQVILRGEARLRGETRVRWKLTPVEADRASDSASARA